MVLIMSDCVRLRETEEIVLCLSHKALGNNLFRPHGATDYMFRCLKGSKEGVIIF